jgi:hypothetical protein
VKEEDLEGFIHSCNFFKRHLSKAQKACIGALASDLVDEVGEDTIMAAGLVVGDKRMSISEAVKKFGISKTYLMDAKKLLKKDLKGFKDVFEGKENFLTVYKNKGEKKSKSKKEYNVKKAIEKQKSLGVEEEMEEVYNLKRWKREAGQEMRNKVEKWKKFTRKLLKGIREDETAFQGSDGELCESLLQDD